MPKPPGQHDATGRSATGLLSRSGFWIPSYGFLTPCYGFWTRYASINSTCLLQPPSFAENAFARRARGI
jgi:hypothetical protein